MTIASQPFVVEVTPGPAGWVVRVAGELDLATVPDLDACLVALDDDAVIDLAELRFTDSTGIAALLRGHLRAVKRGGSFVLRSPTDRVVKVLEIMGPDRVFTIEP